MILTLSDRRRKANSKEIESELKLSSLLWTRSMHKGFCVPVTMNTGAVLLSNRLLNIYYTCICLLKAYFQLSTIIICIWNYIHEYVSFGDGDMLRECMYIATGYWLDRRERDRERQREKEKERRRDCDLCSVQGLQSFAYSCSTCVAFVQLFARC